MKGCKDDHAPTCNQALKVNNKLSSSKQSPLSVTCEPYLESDNRSISCPRRKWLQIMPIPEPRSSTKWMLKSSWTAQQSSLSFRSQQLSPSLRCIQYQDATYRTKLDRHGQETKHRLQVFLLPKMEGTCHTCRGAFAENCSERNSTFETSHLRTNLH